MSISPWITTAKVIIPIEGVFGILINAYLFYALYRSKIGKAARLYRISSMVIAVSGLYTSCFISVFVNIPIFIGNSFATASYGSALFCVSDRVVDRLAVAFFTQTHAMWEMIPAPSIVQWLCLTKPNLSSTRKLIHAYAIPLLFYANSWVEYIYFMEAIVPDEKYRRELEASVHALHGTDLRHFHIHGFKMVDKNGIDLRDIMIFDELPSYLTCYGLFAFCAIQIRSRLRGLGKVASAKTVMMQKRFYRIQIAQVFLPLLLLSPPLGIALMATILGANIANASLIMVYSVWLSPSATALLLLVFVAKSSRISSLRKTTLNVSIFGLLTNAILLIALYRSEIGETARLYNVSGMVTAVSGFYTSFYILIFINIPIFINNSFATANYGPLLFYLSDWANDRLTVAFFTQTHAMWVMVPAPSIVQWMFLARPNSSSAKRLLFAEKFSGVATFGIFRQVVTNLQLESQIVKDFTYLKFTIKEWVRGRKNSHIKCDKMLHSRVCNSHMRTEI